MDDSKFGLPNLKIGAQTWNSKFGLSNLKIEQIPSLGTTYIPSYKIIKLVNECAADVQNVVG